MIAEMTAEEQMRDESYHITILGLSAALYGIFTLMGNIGLIAL